MAGAGFILPALCPTRRAAIREVKRMNDVLVEYRPQSYKWAGITVILPAELASVYEAGKAVQCDLQVAKDGNTTLVRVVPGKTFFLRKTKFSGVSKVLRGEVHDFLASSGSWSGGSNLSGAVAMKSGAIYQYGAKGAWSYLVCDEAGIRDEEHDPRLFLEEGCQRWQPLS